MTQPSQTPVHPGANYPDGAPAVLAQQPVKEAKPWYKRWWVWLIILVVLAGIGERGLLQAVQTAVALEEAGDAGIQVPDYADGNVSAKVVRIVQSYAGIVDKMVWRKG